MKLIRSTLFYLAITGIGAGIIASTQVVEQGGSAGLKEGALRLVDSARAMIGAAPGAPDVPPDAPVPDSEVVQDLPRLPFAPQDPSPPVLADSCHDGQGGRQPVVIGDRLRVRFHEQALGLTEDAARSERDILYERLDLSGSYDVSGEGALSLPLMGRVTVTGRDLACAESLIRLAYFDATRTAILVSAAFETRPQVVVKGAVRAPGVYAHTPGMTAERLLGLAGAASPVIDISARTALVLRGADLARLQAEALGTEIEHRRLAASLRGAATLDLTEKELALVQDLLGPARLAAETDVLAADLADLALDRDQHRAELETLDKRVDDMLSQDALAAEDLKQLYARRDELRTLKARGFVSAQQLDTTLFNIMVSERFRRGLQGSLLELRAGRDRARNAAEQAEVERRQALALQSRDLIEKGNALRRQIDAAQAELALLRAAANGVSDGEGVVIAIDRQTAAGEISLEATLQTAILPGDLVTVSLRPAPQDADSSQLSDLDAQLLPVGAETQHD